MRSKHKHPMSEKGGWLEAADTRRQQGEVRIERRIESVGRACRV
jgi:hypothetical protein